MNKTEIYKFLSEHHIKYEATEHKAVFNMEELNALELPHPEWDAKNLFIRDDKKQNYYLITVKGDKRINLKEFRKSQQLRPLTFASEEDLMKHLQLIPGSVSPLGILNDKSKRVHFYLDSDFVGNMIGIHPNENTATVWMEADQLVHIIQEHGNPVDVIHI